MLNDYFCISKSNTLGPLQATHGSRGRVLLKRRVAFVEKQQELEEKVLLALLHSFWSGERIFRLSG